jgi:hypothetical protein
MATHQNSGLAIASAECESGTFPPVKKENRTKGFSQSRHNEGKQIPDSAQGSVNPSFVTCPDNSPAGSAVRRHMPFMVESRIHQQFQSQFSFTFNDERNDMNFRSTRIAAVHLTKTIESRDGSLVDRSLSRFSPKTATKGRNRANRMA